MDKPSAINVIGEHDSVQPCSADNCAFTCNMCGKLFQSKVKLDTHHSIHTQAKKHVCAK